MATKSTGNNPANRHLSMVSLSNKTGRNEHDKKSAINEVLKHRERKGGVQRRLLSCPEARRQA